jgi:hypothetical protein
VAGSTNESMSAEGSQFGWSGDGKEPPSDHYFAKPRGSRSALRNGGAPTLVLYSLLVIQTGMWLPSFLGRQKSPKALPLMSPNNPCSRAQEELDAVAPYGRTLEEWRAARSGWGPNEVHG